MAVRLFSNLKITHILAPNSIKKLNGCSGVIFGLQENTRQLYAKTTLGIDGFLRQKEDIQKQMAEISEKFKEKIQEYCKDVNKNMIFTEDLKNMIHLASSDEDVDVVIKMIKKYNQQNKQLRFGNFVFGPVVMRFFHIHNLPDIAVECFKAPELTGFFDQLITYQILLDILYENQRYQDILEMVEDIKNRQVEGHRYPKNVVVFAMAACYKLNTKESFDYAMKLWKDLLHIGHLPMRRTISFCAAIALNHGDPAAALEILTHCRNPSYTTIRNIKLLALVETGRVEYLIPLLKNILPQDVPHDHKHTFNKDVIERLQESLKTLNNTENVAEINRLVEQLQKNGNISDKTLDQDLCAEIIGPSTGNRQDRIPRRNNFDRNSNSQNRPFRQGYTRRPALHELV